MEVLIRSPEKFSRTLVVARYLRTVVSPTCVSDNRTMRYRLQPARRVSELRSQKSRFGMEDGMKSRMFMLMVMVMASLSFSACGGGSTTAPSPTTYTIGGTVSGLSGTGLMLQNNGGNNLAVSANGGFTFTTPVASGGTYNLTVLTQPSSPAQTCVVTNGSGTANVNVTSVQVTCSTTVVTYTIGGTVSGLLGTGLVLQNNGGNNLAVSANGGFTFTTPVASGGTYNVTVLTQPSSPAQTCVVTNGSGTANANVTSVQVSCTNTSTIGEWMWMGGADVVNQQGTYGTQGTAAPGNVPGARYSAVSSTDAAGNFWLFGGYYESLVGGVVSGFFNDLWKYSAGEWTWVSGANVVGQLGTYGTRGTAAPSNIPGARFEAVSWTDAAGNFWLFGGSGLDSTGAAGGLNDLWKYSASAGEWTWMGGADVVNQRGTYGHSAAPGNVPGARSEAVSWTDAAGNFWLFGGLGYDSTGADGGLNDLWKYSASAGEWTWVSGAAVVNQQGTYGTQGTAAPSNIPGARASAVSWTDAAGNFWLFGGSGLGSTGAEGWLNDLWKYSASAGEWTWMGGADVVNQQGTYGTQGTDAPGNVPGARNTAVSWTDAAGNFWLFGGSGLDSTGAAGGLNDLWKYSASAGEWTWMGGADVVNQQGTYGTQGTAAPGNVPGARNTAVSWTDATGNFWLFGGSRLDSTGADGQLNDLWKYEP